MKKILCYYHGDNDGIASAAIINQFYKKGDELKFVECNYGQDIPIHMDYDKLFIVDFSFPPEIMKKFWDRYGDNLTWIDHHKSAMEKNPEMWSMETNPGMEESIPVHGLRRLDLAGCELTWEYFHTHKIPPKAIQYIGDYDLFEFEYGDFTKAFCGALGNYTTNPADEIWEDLLDGEWELMDKIIEDGMPLIKKTNDHAEKTFKDGRDFEFKGHKCRLMNTNSAGCWAGRVTYLKEEYDMGIVFSFRQGYVVVGLYSNSIDTSKISKNYGGGGHPGASGFELSYDEFYNEFIKEGEKQ